jgi:predicted transposase YdaD
LLYEQGYGEQDILELNHFLDMLKDNFSLEQIAQLTGLTIEQIEKLQTQVNWKR